MRLPDQVYHPEDKHPEPYQQDLNPEANVGQSHGDTSPRPEKTEESRTAHDVKELHDQLQGYTADELKQIPVLPSGTRLRAGATYIDLKADPPREFGSAGDLSAGDDQWIVPKTGVPYPLWNRLIGVTDPARLDQEAE